MSLEPIRLAGRCQIGERILDVPLRNAYGLFKTGAYTVEVSGETSEHLLLYRNLSSPVCNLRINSACFTGDLLGCDRCDCSWQLHFAMQLIARRNQGLIIYHLDHEGRANGLVAKLRSFGRDLGSVDFEERYNKLDDQRRFDTAVTIIRDLGVSAVNLITNNPDKKRILEREGISVVSVIPVVATDRKLQAYYEFKRTQLRHLIPRH